MDINNTLEEWMEVKQKLSEYKAKENQLRRELCKRILRGIVKGSRSEIVGKYKVTATAKINNTVDEEVLLTIWSDLSDSEKACFKFSPQLILKQYNDLPEDAKTIYSAITSRPGLPSLSLKEKKDK